MENNTISSCRCPCFSCIVETSLKYEEAKNFNKSYQLFNENIKFLENTLKKVEKAKQDFLTRVRLLNIKLDDITNMSEEKENLLHSDACESFIKKTDKSKKKEKVRVAVAIFDEESDPNKKPMYPKHLVYADGQDVQLEEIRAQNYWKKIKNEEALKAKFKQTESSKKLIDNFTQTELPVAKAINENFTQTEAPNPITENASQTERPFVIEKASQTERRNHKQTESRIGITVENSSLKPFVEKVQNVPPVISKGTKHDEEIETVQNPITSETFVKSRYSKPKTIDIQEETENAIPPMDFLKNNENDDSFTCTTKTFKVLYSSTPFQANKKRNQEQEEALTNSPFTNEPSNKNDSLPHVKSNGNLSMILELSKERFSQSTSSGKNSGIASKTFVVSEYNINKEPEKNTSNNDPFNLKTVTNPFEDPLIDYFLQRVSFPSDVHSPGYLFTDSEMPNARPLCSIRLGGEKFNVTGEIGKGAYARILKIHPDNKSSKSIALKQQKPACLWEWYINKEISHRLNDQEKEKFFMQYTKMFVFKNGSLMLSDWARFGTILNLINNLKSAKNKLDRCPMGMCAYLSVQLISSIQYLHSCQIIHGDVKPDNFVLTAVPSSTLLQVKLIDYGRCIDMQLFPPDKTFTYVVTTDDFTCNEMKEKKPWSYQIDLYGLAGAIYLLLMGDYMKTEKRGDFWVLKRSLHRYLNPEVWNPIFDSLLNVPSCSELPDLSKLKQNLEEQLLYKIDKYNMNQQVACIYNILNKK